MHEGDQDQLNWAKNMESPQNSRFSQFGLKCCSNVCLHSANGAHHLYEMPFLQQKKSLHLTFSSRRSAIYKVPPHIGGHHFLLCQQTNTKDIAGQSAMVWGSVKLGCLVIRQFSSQTSLVFEFTPVTAIRNFEMGTGWEKRDLVIGISPFYSGLQVFIEYTITLQKKSY